MRIALLARILLSTVLALSLSGCWFRRKPKQPLPPPPQQPPIVKPQQTPTQPVQVPDQVPVPPVKKPSPQPPPMTTPEKKPEPESEPPQRTPRVRPPSQPKAPVKKPAASVPQEEPAPVPQQPAPAGKLGEILTDEQKSEYRRSFQQSDAAARKLIDDIARHRLSAEQQDVLARIRSFLQQAAEAAPDDWSLAAQLAKRAELLARDLESGLR